MAAIVPISWLDYISKTKSDCLERKKNNFCIKPWYNNSNILITRIVLIELQFFISVVVLNYYFLEY
jgi:hypothetical protein